MSPDDPGAVVWRVELRAGKRYLKDRWTLTTWHDLDATAGDLFARVLSEVRYTAPSTDGNRARWPDHLLWRMVRDVVKGDLAEMVSGVEPSRIKAVIRDHHRVMLERQFVGLGATVAGLSDFGHLPPHDVGAKLSDGLQANIAADPEAFTAKLREVGERYIFLA